MFGAVVYCLLLACWTIWVLKSTSTRPVTRWKLGYKPCGYLFLMLSGQVFLGRRQTWFCTVLFVFVAVAVWSCCTVRSDFAKMPWSGRERRLRHRLQPFALALGSALFFAYSCVVRDFVEEYEEATWRGTDRQV